MLSKKLFLPMSSESLRDYVVTLSEQQHLARKFGLEMHEVASKLLALKERLATGELVPQKTATKTRRIIYAHFESSNATGRQGALGYAAPRVNPEQRYAVGPERGQGNYP